MVQLLLSSIKMWVCTPTSSHKIQDQQPWDVGHGAISIILSLLELGFKIGLTLMHYGNTWVPHSPLHQQLVFQMLVLKLHPTTHQPINSDRQVDFSTFYFFCHFIGLIVLEQIPHKSSKNSSTQKNCPRILNAQTGIIFQVLRPLSQRSLDSVGFTDL